MSDTGWIAAITALGVAFIAAAREVLLLWIRARHKWRNGTAPDKPEDTSVHH